MHSSGPHGRKCSRHVVPSYFFLTQFAHCIARSGRRCAVVTDSSHENANGVRVSNRFIFHQPAPQTFLESVLTLIGHLGASSLLFFLLFFFGWAISWLLHLLDSIHRFAPSIVEVITKIEIVLVYFDAFLFAFVVLIGPFRFVIHLMKGPA